MAQVVILDFSGVYGRMRFWEHENAVWLDFKNLEGTNCYCDDEAAETITEQMRKLGAEGIHFLDSGNYHYATKLWTDQIRCPFDLLVLGFSISYIPLGRIGYSLLTVLISGQLIGWVQRVRIPRRAKE